MATVDRIHSGSAWPLPETDSSEIENVCPHCVDIRRIKVKTPSVIVNVDSQTTRRNQSLLNHSYSLCKIFHSIMPLSERFKFML